MDASAKDAFFLDLDGTLIETAPTPEAARAGPRVACVLRRLSAATQGATMIVSGRPIATVDALLALRLPAAGQHGAEIRMFNPALESVRIEIDRFADLVARCRTVGERYPGCFLEIKMPTLALHLEASDPGFAAMFADLREVAAAWDGALTCVTAHNVVELRPAHADKGRVLDCAGLFRPFAGRRPIFIGNDIPDIDGFRAATLAGGYGLSVGRALPWARHTLADPDAVLDALERIAGPR